jgi:hypothetical protein
MKDQAKQGKIGTAKEQKDFLKSVLTDSDEDVDMDPETADALVESQKSYATELRAKMKRRKEGKATDADADFEAPTKEEIDDMMAQTMKLRAQRKLAKKQAEDEAAMNENSTNASNSTTGAAATGALTPSQREAKLAERETARKAKKEELEMLRDLQAVQGTALKD